MGDTDPFAKRFRQRLRSERAARGWKQSDISRMLADRGVPTHATTITKVEAGDRAVRIDEAVAIADIFGMSLDAFLGRGQSSEAQLTDVLRTLQSTARQSNEFATASAAALRDRSIELAAFQFDGRDDLIARTNAARDALSASVTALQKLLQINSSEDIEAAVSAFFADVSSRFNDGEGIPDET